MKTTKFSIAALALMSVSAGAGLAQTLTLNFSALQNSDIVFGGAADTFSFTTATPAINLGSGAQGPGGFAQWSITSESGGSSAIGLDGNIDSGPFSYGPLITVTGSGAAQIQSATVNGPLGMLDLSDGLGGLLQGTVNAITISTYGTAGVGGALNPNLIVNLTGVTYSGANADLQYLTANQPGTVDLAFQFNPGMTLQQLSSGAGGYSTSYNGSISVSAVPEPATTAAGVAGLMIAVGGLALRRKQSA